MTSPYSVAAGQTAETSGDIEAAITLDILSTLDIAAGTAASLFGGIVASGTAAIVLGAGAVLFAPAATPAGVTVSFDGAGSELILAVSTLGDFKGQLADLPPDAVIDVTGCQITTVTTIAVAGGAYGLVLSGSQGVLGTIDVGLAPPTLIVAIPDGCDGSLLLSGPAPPHPGAAAATVSEPAASFAWTGGAAGSWADPSAWLGTPGRALRAPGLRDTVTIAGEAPGLTALAGAGSCNVLHVSGSIALIGPFSATTVTVGLAKTDALILMAGTDLAATDVTVQAGVLSIQAATLSAAGILTISGFLDATSASTIIAAGVRLGNGTLRLSNDTGLLVGAGDSRTPGAVTIAHDGLLSGTGTIDAAVTLLGELEVAPGTMSVFGGITGTGTITLDAGGTLFASGGIGSATVRFAGSGTTLETFGVVSGTLINGFGPGDVLEIAGASAGALTWTPSGSGGTLDLGVYGAVAIEVSPGLDPQRATFSESADGFGGVSITVLPCFSAPTRLRTPAGWIEAGTVTPQTWLCTAGGAARRAVWIGRTTVEGWRRAKEPYLDPVLLRAGALGPGRPITDLRLSPLHGIILDTAMGPRVIPAVALCDGRRITRDRNGTRLDYVHIALERHDALLAEDLACESFLAHGPDPRGQFTRSSGRAPKVTRAMAERLETGPMLHAVRSRLELRQNTNISAQGRGAMDKAKISGSTSLLEGWTGETDQVALLVDGVIGWRGRRDVWRADLEAAGINEGVAAFMATIPRPDPRATLSLRSVG